MAVECQIEKQKTNKIYGLNYTPKAEEGLTDDDIDCKEYLHLRGGPNDNSKYVLDIIRKEIENIGDCNILEIGVSLYEPENSITHVMNGVKTKNSKYLGIDIKDRSFIESMYGNCHFLQTSSFNIDEVKNKLKELSMDKLSVLMIDGLHSVNGCKNDWLYSELVIPGGIVLIHDVNSHPGPKSLVKAIDRSMFYVEEPLKNKIDYGIAICRKK